MHATSLINVTPTLALSRNIFNDILEILQNESEQIVKLGGSNGGGAYIWELHIGELRKQSLT
jgi:hypothetical protein